MLHAAACEDSDGFMMRKGWEIRMNILISACLLGVACRYNGTGILVSEEIKELIRQHTLIPVCPEQLGGLCTPRPPVELHEDRAMTKDRYDVTEAFQKGADMTLAQARLYQCSYAILKENSPSCGSSHVYDGSFCGRIIEGQGITAALLRNEGITVINEHQINSKGIIV